ncbi:M67 family metallopeptidase [Novosphingobium colocasiae]|uniref:M67 family metallopeptidase n=1 Tax=Novosphingobium colocasiae TaxID=1256513 RepID=UPI0035B112D8
MDDGETRVLAVARAVVSLLHEEAALAAPLECCGLLLGPARDHVTRALPTANVAADPRRRFEIDPRPLLDAHRAERAGGERIVGYYHSHPAGAAVPSATDGENSTGDLRIWAIIGEGQVAFWRDSGNGFVEQSWRRVDDDPGGV